jgi:hypothetical protein
MRRVIAVFSLLCLANLVFVQSGSACPLTPPGDSAAVSHTGHEGHDMTGATSGSMNHEMVQSAPDESASHSSTCPAMNACLVTLDATSEPAGAAPDAHVHIVGGSDDRPVSLTAAPELPPPRG